MTQKKKKVLIEKKKTSKTRSRKIFKDEIKIDQILLHNRQIFLTGVINDEKTHEINTKLHALNAYSPGTSIILWINSPGGSIQDGLAIIDCMTGIESPVITIINGSACSMAGVISIFGTRRMMTKNSTWMAHDVTTFHYDYLTKAEDRFEYSKKLASTIMKMFRNKTKLQEKDLEKARHGELWLNSKECKKKGIIEEILG